jgi:hypothetical protein
MGSSVVCLAFTAVAFRKFTAMKGNPQSFLTFSLPLMANRVKRKKLYHIPSGLKSLLVKITRRLQQKQELKIHRGIIPVIAKALSAQQSTPYKKHSY